jgi:hypothetical protein
MGRIPVSANSSPPSSEPSQPVLTGGLASWRGSSQDNERACRSIETRKATVDPGAGEAIGLSREAEFEVLRQADSSRNTTGQSGGDCILTLMLRAKPGQELAGGVSCARASGIGVGWCGWDSSSNKELVGSAILTGGTPLQKPPCSTYEHPAGSWLKGGSLRNDWEGPIVQVALGSIAHPVDRPAARRRLSGRDRPRQGKSAFRGGTLG